MSLLDVQHQIDAATFATEKLDATKGQSCEDVPSKVRSGILREFSAFKKVLETSKSRLQELQTMQATLDAMEDEPILSHHNKSAQKRQIAKSPHWLPSLGQRKQFTFGDATRVRPICINVFLLPFFIHITNQLFLFEPLVVTGRPSRRHDESKPGRKR
jgi:hypothetical protein